MTAYTLDISCPTSAGDAGPAAALPTDLDPEDINL
jgi:hypothetical protein